MHRLAGDADVEQMLSAVEPRVWLARNEIQGAGSRYQQLLDGAPVTESAARGSDLAVVIFTAGSTGGPKAALLTQRSLAYKARIMGRVHGLRRRDAVLMPAPLAHVSGLLNGFKDPSCSAATSRSHKRATPSPGVGCELAT